jgi:hypothetical protein
LRKFVEGSRVIRACLWRVDPEGVHGKEDPMTKMKRLGAMLFAVCAFAAAVAPAALGDAPGPGDKPQCAGGPSNGNPHCPQNK